MSIMSNFLKKSLFILFLGLCGILNAQSIEYTTEWKLFKEEQGIKFYYKYADCDFTDKLDAQWVLLKIENTTNKTLLIEWNLYNYFNGVCGLCKNDPNNEAHKEIKLAPNSSIEGECVSHCPKSLRIFSKFLEFKTDDLLTKFEIKNLILTEVK